MFNKQCYLVLEPVFSRWNSTRPFTFRVARVTQNRPRRATGIILKLSLSVPEEAFTRYLEASVEIDPSLVGTIIVEQKDAS